MGCKMIIHIAVIITFATTATNINFTVPFVVTLMKNNEALCVCIHIQSFKYFILLLHHCKDILQETNITNIHNLQ